MMSSSPSAMMRTPTAGINSSCDNLDRSFDYHQHGSKFCYSSPPPLLNTLCRKVSEESQGPSVEEILETPESSFLYSDDSHPGRVAIARRSTVINASSAFGPLEPSIFPLMPDSPEAPFLLVPRTKSGVVVPQLERIKQQWQQTHNNHDNNIYNSNNDINQRVCFRDLPESTLIPLVAGDDVEMEEADTEMLWRLGEPANNAPKLQMRRSFDDQDKSLLFMDDSQF